MKKIEGVDLETAFKQAEAESVEAQTRMIAGAIKDVLTWKRSNAQIKLERARADVARLEAECTKLDETLEKIKKGDWSVLPEPKEEKASQ